jgi:hypothetical protein
LPVVVAGAHIQVVPELVAVVAQVGLELPQVLQ